MSLTFILHLQGATQSDRIEGVVSFWGKDASGAFAIWPGHVRMLTVLELGLARFRCEEGSWEYLALPGAVLYFVPDESSRSGGQLFLSCRKFVRGRNLETIEQALETQISEEERQFKDIKTSLRKMEEAMFKRLWQLGRESK
ncbi:ATP synthase F0F1 subunit epsilon [Methylohalobius crimeensis]|uniref:ATP synthase F0F1 subunit epsilon n=1 Tax=Methylohalobius crimeensis TaxID=244365 RepID=UPI0003B4218A|nr:ATP synthase F0F1 subunit epsilon [Methylohalobius crimeensis]